jgi:orotate phosphoribosyltransferase
MSGNNRLAELFRERAVKFGQFTLASGKTSSFYIDSKQVLFCGEALALIADGFLDHIVKWNVTAVGGLEVGAIPLAAAVVLRGHQRGIQLEGFFVRKAVKEHGSLQRLEGRLAPGSRVAIVEDVITTGGSSEQAIEVLQAQGHTVCGLVCLVDRGQGGRERFSSRFPFEPLLVTEDLGLPKA